jgi:antitoxin YobK
MKILPSYGLTLDSELGEQSFTMSIEKYEQARRLIEDVGGGDFEGVKPETLVAKAEAALGVSFPPSYRRFLLEMGCGDINGLEVFGLIHDNFENSTLPNGIWLTLNERRGIGLHPAYVLIGEGGDGTFYSLDTRQKGEDGEAPVVRLSADGKRSERVADSFGNYFLEAVRSVL